MCMPAGFNYEFSQVVDGSEVALVYHLVQRSSGPLPVFQDVTDIQEFLEAAACIWSSSGMPPKRMYHILDHE